MEGNNLDNNVLKKYAKEIQSEKLPPSLFGNIVNLISKTSIVIFMEQLVHQISSKLFIL